MFKKLHMKLVVILLLLIISLMAVVGVFLITSVANFYKSEFGRQMTEAFSENVQFVQDLTTAAQGDNAVAQLSGAVKARSALLGIDGRQRFFYILNGENGEVLSDEASEVNITPNILTAIETQAPAVVTRLYDSFFDCAVPFAGANGSRYIVYIKDSRESLQRLTAQLVSIVLNAVLFGFLISIFLAFLLSKTMTTPIESLTRSAALVANGDFSKPLEIHSSDEIGVLTKTFNNMSKVLKETIDAVGSERDKLGTLFVYMTDGMVAFTRDGALLHINPAATRLLSIKSDQEPTFSGILGQVTTLEELAKIKPPDYEEHLTKQGDRNLQIFFAPFGIDGAQEGGIMAIIHDITELTKLDEVRREFVSNVSHELRTPLTNVKSYAETLINSDDLPPETIKSFSMVIVNEADRMTRLVRDLLTLSRFDYGKMDWSVCEFDFALMISKMQELMHIEAERHHHRLTVEIKGTIPFIFGDRERLEQVYINILGNAITYTPDGGEITITCGTTPKNVWVTVSDNGIGIPSDDIPRLFERFYRVDKARSRSSGGTGLGLAIAKEIVDKHKGSIRVNSAVNVGTSVTVTLPVSGADKI